MNDLKSIGIKIIENSKYQNGYGEGVCLILTQLLDKYLINQNFIFKKPILIEETDDGIQNEFEEVILEDNNYTQNQSEKNTTNTNIYFYNNTKSNLTGLIRNTMNANKKRFHSGKSNVTQGKLY